MSEENIKPLRHRVLIKRDKISKTKGGILIPDSAQERSRQGEVLAVGPGKIDEDGKLNSVSIAVGQRVLFSSYSGVEVESTDDAEYLVLSEDDVLATITGGSNG